jgi:ribose 5-phosphate isomerase
MDGTVVTIGSGSTAFSFLQEIIKVSEYKNIYKKAPKKVLGPVLEL